MSTAVIPQPTSDPFASIAQPVQTSSAAQGASDPFASIAKPATGSSAAPGFIQRGWETSPGPGLISAAKESITDFVKGPDQATEAFNQMVGSLRDGDFSGLRITPQSFLLAVKPLSGCSEMGRQHHC
jgi:hypothetical protein